MRLGIAHHLGWAVVVTASADHKVVDRRRIELIEPGMPTASIHHKGGPHLLHLPAKPLDDNALANAPPQRRVRRGPGGPTTARSRGSQHVGIPAVRG